MLVVSVSVGGGHHTALDAKWSWITFATGAKQLVVQEAFEILWCFAGCRRNR